MGAAGGDDVNGGATAGDPTASGMATSHPDRDDILAELHARPFMPVEAPRRLFHFAYLTDAAASAADRAALTAFARRHGGGTLPAGAPHLTLSLLQGRLRWERHTEFTTYGWDFPVTGDTPAWAESPAFLPPDAPPPPGPMVVALELLLEHGEGRVTWEERDTIRWRFNASSLCVSAVDGGAAVVATDFRAHDDGLTRILVLDNGLTPRRAASLVRQLVEIETYRTLALLALPLVRRVTPDLDRIEADLVTMLEPPGEDLDGAYTTTLTRLTDTATALESRKAQTSYRFAASRAYHDIVCERLESLNAAPVEGHIGWDTFLNRRLGPALRTVQSLRERQDSLSLRLSRATELLRTRVDITLEAQNNEVLKAMNRRSELQLRLQQTVEGLSVAAITYYIVGLVAYLAKGAEEAGLPLHAPTATAVAVVPVALAVWLVVRSIRHRFVHRGEG